MTESMESRQFMMKEFNLTLGWALIDDPLSGSDNLDAALAAHGFDHFETIGRTIGEECGCTTTVQIYRRHLSPYNVILKTVDACGPVFCQDLGSMFEVVRRCCPWFTRPRTRTLRTR